LAVVAIFVPGARPSDGSFSEPFAHRNCASTTHGVAAHRRSIWSRVRRQSTRSVFAAERAATLSVRFVGLTRTAEL
jgi:hypothetical protein